MKYVVEIEETLSKRVVVEADSEFDATEKVRRMYAIEEVVLDSEDHVATDIHVVGESN